MLFTNNLELKVETIFALLTASLPKIGFLTAIPVQEFT